MRSTAHNVCDPIIIVSLIAATSIEYRSESQTTQSYELTASGRHRAMAFVGDIGGSEASTAGGISENA